MLRQEITLTACGGSIATAVGILKIRFPVLEGDKLMKEVLNGGYNVHPVPPPNSEIKERIRKRYERERIKIEKLLTLGYTTSGDP